MVRDGLECADLGLGFVCGLVAWGAAASHCGGLETSATVGGEMERVPPGSRRVVRDGLECADLGLGFVCGLVAWGAAAQHCGGLETSATLGAALCSG